MDPCLQKIIATDDLNEFRKVAMKSKVKLVYDITHDLIVNESVKIMKWLQKAGFDIYNEPNFCTACFLNKIHVVRLFLNSKCGIDVNCYNNYPLEVAAQNKCHYNIKLLIIYGAIIKNNDYNMLDRKTKAYITKIHSQLKKK